MFGLDQVKAYFRNASIQVKLTWAIGAVTILGLIFVASALSIREYINRRQQTEQDLSSLASIVAWNSKAALAFKDFDLANESLQSLKNQPSVVSALL